MKRTALNPLASLIPTLTVAAVLTCSCISTDAASTDEIPNRTPQIRSGPTQNAESCGAIALAQLSHALGLNAEVEERIRNAQAPLGGFSLADLQKLGTANGMKLQAIRVSTGAELPVPCIVHWKVGHYGVILEKKGSNYRITSQPSRQGAWVNWRTLEIYASGAFLAPEDSTGRSWAQLSQPEAESFRGSLQCYGYYHGGYCSGIPADNEDPPADCCDDNDDQDASCDPPSANDGADDSGGGGPPPPPCCCDMGMPRWYVSEPYINLWLIDRPLLYKTSHNKWFPLKLTYKSRGVDHGTNSFGFGPRWECNWIGMIQVNATNGTMQATNYHAGGGMGQVNWACQLFGGGCLQYGSAQTFIAPSGGSAPAMVSSRGGMNQFGFTFEPQTGFTNYYMDQRIDRYGRTVHYNYEIVAGVARLKTVQDTDGRLSTITYGTSNLISSIADPYGHTAYFFYNATGYLASIEDAIGMTSSFSYDTNGFITSMTTPYGTTGFDHYSDTNGNRGILVTEPNSANQLYTLVSEDFPPTSYHWDRFQYTAISEDGRTNYLEMPPSDYDYASIKQWLVYARNDEDLMVMSDTLTLSGPPVDPLWNNRVGMYSFTYPGQTNSTYTGFLKRVASISRDGTLLTAIDRNDLGRPSVVTNYNGDGSTSARANTFDSSERYLQKQTGSHGELVRGYGYHPVIANLLVSVTNAVGDVTRYTHDTNTMKVTSITFPGGLVRTNEYSGGFLTKQTDIGIRTNSFTYSNGNVASETDELGLTTTRSYDALNRLQQITFPDATTISNLYDKLDLVGVKDRLGHWTQYTYNPVRQLIGETNADGAVTTYTYCSCGSPDSITHWNGSTALTDTFAYDVLGRLTNATYADGYQLNYLYDNFGFLSFVSDSSGLTVALSHYQVGEKFKLWEADFPGPLRIVANTYDDYGRLASTVDRNGITSSNIYDSVDRIVARITIDEFSTPYATNAYTYNARGLTNTVDSLNHTNWFVRDAAGRLQYQTNANNEVLQFAYNPAGELLSLIDGKNQTITWHYDEYGRVTNKLDQSGAEILRYVYDPAGRLTNRWSAAKGNTKYKYDSVGNLTNIDYPVSSDVSFAYDSLNRLTNMIDGVGTTLFSYTGSGQLFTEDGPFASDTITNFYWNRMRTNLTLVQPTGTWTNAFSYDSVNRLYGVASRAGTFTYNYDEPSTRLSGLTLPSGSYIFNQFDSMSRLTSTFLYNSSGTIVFDGYTYAYDSESQRTNEVREDSSTVGYSYDNIGQLIVANSSVPSEDRGYTYDTAWNLNFRTNIGSLSTFLVDNKNELTNAFATLNTYDSNGNLTGVGSGKVYVYDDENRLLQWFSYQHGVSSPTNGDLRTDFAYDGLGRLRVRTEYTLSCIASNGGGGGGSDALFGGVHTDTGGGPNCNWNVTNTVRYVYDGWRVVQERDGNNTPLCAYTRGNDLSVSLEGAGGIGGLLARTKYVTGNPTSSAFYFSDGNGNVTSLIDTNNSVVASYRYDPFGNIISKSGSLADVNVYRFSSKEVHINSGMYYYGFRFYDPNLQRWINRDPLQEFGGINLYCFVGNSPANSVDADGLVDLWHLFSMPTFMDQQGNVHYGTPPSEQHSTYDPDSYLAQRGVDTSFMGGCMAGDFLKENAQKVLQDSAETLAAMTPAGEAASGLKAGEEALAAKRAAALAKVADDLHHAYPKYLGGPIKQALEKLPRAMHQTYHKGLDAIAPRWKGTEYYDGLPPSEKTALLKQLVDYTKEFDKKYGTHLTDALLRAGCPN